MTTTIIALWATILNRVADSRLLFKSEQFHLQAARERIVKAFRQCGVETERLTFLTFIPSFEAHLQVYNRIDIALDTFPYHGTTTTFEALWMGVPVVTLAGQEHRSRVGVSILSNLDMHSCIAKTKENYVDIACQLAMNTEALKKSRSNLRQKLEASSLLDKAGFTARLENEYRKLLTTSRVQ